MWWWMMVGCGMGPSAETLVEELRVLAAIAEPPEVGAGEQVVIDTLILDPQERGFDAMTWSCTFDGEGCLESGGFSGRAWDTLSVYEAPTEEWFTDQYFVPAEFESALSETPIPLTQHWTLACERGVCPALELARENPPPDTADGERLQELLSDPFDFMADLPIAGVSLGLRTVLASTRSSTARLTNPTIACETETPKLSPGASAEFTCALTGSFTGFSGVWGYTTAGGWDGANQVITDVNEDAVTYTYFAPEEAAGEVALWVTAVDGEGGVGLWSGSVTVQ